MENSTGSPTVHDKGAFPPSDGRSAEARKNKRLVDSFTSYLDHVPPTKLELALAKGAAALLMRLEVFNAQIIRGEDTDTREHCRVGNAMLNALDALGVTPFKRRRHSW